MKDILQLLENDSRLTVPQLALMLEKDEKEIKEEIDKYEKEGIIVGYPTLIDWDKTGREHVSAIIELKVTPARDRGFDYIAEKIYNYPEVKSLSLMSGGYDLMVIIEGKTMREIAFFVADKLSTLDGVVSTATHFFLKKYKDEGIIYEQQEKDERGFEI